MKKYILLLFTITITLITIIYKTKQSKKYTIAVIQCASNKSLNLLADTFIKKITELLGVKNITIIHKNAEGSESNINVICKQLYLNKDIDLFFTIGSAPSQAIGILEQNRPIIAAGISAKPEAYNLNKKNICGSTTLINEEIVMGMINHTHNQINNYGILRTAGKIYEEEFSYFKELCKKENKAIIDFAVNSESEIIAILDQICQKVGLILIACDSLVASVLPYIIKITTKYKIPVFTCFIEGIEEGAFASTGINYELNGIESAELAAKILLNKINIKDIGFKKARYESVYYNQKLFNYSI